MVKSCLKYKYSLSFQRFYVLVFCFNLLAFISLSCTKENTDSPDSGDITLSSETFNTSHYYILGYSFEKQAFYKNIETQGIIDIYLSEVLIPNGDLAGVQFSTTTVPGSKSGFYRNAEFTDSQEAEEFYKNYTSANIPLDTTITDIVKKLDIYTFRTWKTNYVKFLVKDIRFINKGDRADYIEVDIKYFIKRDGSVNFGN